MFKKAMLRGLLGIPIGIAIMTTIGLFISLSLGEFSPRLATFTQQYILSCILGFGFASASTIYEVDQWSITKQTFLHFIITSALFLPVSLLAGWVSMHPISLAIYFLIFIIIYVIIWSSLRIYWTLKIKQLNDSLKKDN